MTVETVENPMQETIPTDSEETPLKGSDASLDHPCIKQDLLNAKTVKDTQENAEMSSKEDIGDQQTEQRTVEEQAEEQAEPPAQDTVKEATTAVQEEPEQEKEQPVQPEEQEPEDTPQSSQKQIEQHLEEYTSTEFTSQENMTEEEEGPDREIISVSFGPKGSWFVRWSDGMSAWEGLAPTLHAKLNGRLNSLPGVRSLSISELGYWAAVFEDGSAATSGISVEGKLREALAVDEEVRSLILAPGGGWILTREDGSFAHERLPSGLSMLLARRIKGDPPIDLVAISGFGGWFVRFADGECEWESIPKALEKFLIQMIRKGDPNLLLTLSPTDGTSYFVAIGDVAEWVHESATLRNTLETANVVSDLSSQLSSVHLSQSQPSSRRSSMARSSRSSLRNLSRQEVQ